MVDICNLQRFNYFAKVYPANYVVVEIDNYDTDFSISSDFSLVVVYYHWFYLKGTLIQFWKSVSTFACALKNMPTVWH